MSRRTLAALALTGGLLLPAAISAQANTRAVRRDIPLTNMIRRAFAAGTRDSTGRPGAKYWQQRVDYDIDARLDPSTSIVSGREHVTIHNNSDSTLRSIRLRLDQNIFRADAMRAESMTNVEVTDGMVVTSLAIDGKALDLAAQGVQTPFGRAPSLADQLRSTNASIALASPISGKGTAVLDIEWSFRVPEIKYGRGVRMGRWADTLYQVAQWYPRVAVYDDLRGWDTDPYLGPSEFYNNFGRFDLKVTVPAGWLVGATGVLQNAREVLTDAVRQRLAHVLDSDSTTAIVTAADRAAGSATAAGAQLVWHFVADTVGDVAWAASNKYLWDATRATIPGRAAPIPVNVLYLPGHANGSNGRAGFAQAGPVLQHALSFYSKLWMPYVFPQLTMVDGPEGGMEYPMFIMSSVGAADHETEHQWAPMMVGTNETWYGFMDEGFNQYANILSHADAQHVAPRLDGLGQQYGMVSGNEQEAPLMWDANYGGPMYGFQAYSKAPLMLSSLGGIVGDTAVQRAMSEYDHAWLFRHPSPWDFAFFMDNALHRDLGWFWYSWLFTTDRVDGSIQKVTTAGGRTTVIVRQDGQMPSPVVLQVKFADKGAPIRRMPNATMTDSVTALVTYPVDVWFGGSRTYSAVLSFGGRKIERITLDPFGRFPDRDISDNVWPRSGVAGR